MEKMEITPKDIREMLDREAARINSPEFIHHDPVQFPRRFDLPTDIELVALLAATIAWGNRKMICRSCEKLLGWMGGSPTAYVLDQGYEDLDPAANVHRTFFARNLQHYLRGWRLMLQRHGSLQGYARALRIADDEAPSWRLAEGLGRIIAEANQGHPDPRCVPGNLATTALKRINMALRWLVRRDGIVDLGIWDVITPPQLFIPLDVHVGRTARDLGLLTRRQDDRRAVLELTALLRTYRPDDPAIYDFALFGLGLQSTQSPKTQL
ncbi:MAG: TIGR02757 family protein [Bacteroidales bacterium]|nr:TIGR02757 family protein [Bacteroidales bacterium]